MLTETDAIPALAVILYVFPSVRPAKEMFSAFCFLQITSPFPSASVVLPAVSCPQQVFQSSFVYPILKATPSLGEPQFADIPAEYIKV